MNDLRDVVRAVLTRHTGDAWAQLGKQVGVAGLAVPEEHGGAGAGLAETHVVLEELGRVLVHTPLLSCALAAEALTLSGNAQACARLLPPLAAGDLTATVILDPAQVLDAGGTLLFAHDDGLFEVSEAEVTPLESLDSTRELSRVKVHAATWLGAVDTQRLRDLAAVLLSAEQVGAAARALELTVDYTKLRVQFGRPIGAFQAIQHRLADLHVLVESARAVSVAAATGLAHPSVAKAYCSETFARAAAEMIQLHGGIGITWEHDAHRFFKRAHSSWHLFGAPREHVSRLTTSALID